MIKVSYPFKGKTQQAEAPSKDRKKRQRYGMLLFLLGGILIFYKGSHDVYYSLRTYTWPSVEGKIVFSRVERVWHPGQSPTYYPQIQYVYLVEGKEYRGKVVFFSEYGTGSTAGAQATIDKYPEGKIVAVYYNPKDPQNAVLERGLHWPSFALILFGLIFGAVGVIGFLYWEILTK